jgi:hypothetical protein
MWNKSNHIVPSNSRTIQIWADCKTGQWAWNGTPTTWVGFYCVSTRKFFGTTRKDFEGKSDALYELSNASHWAELLDAPTN